MFVKSHQLSVAGSRTVVNQKFSQWPKKYDLDNGVGISLCLAENVDLGEKQILRKISKGSGTSNSHVTFVFPQVVYEAIDYSKITIPIISAFFSERSNAFQFCIVNTDSQLIQLMSNIHKSPA